MTTPPSSLSSANPRTLSPAKEATHTTTSGASAAASTRVGRSPDQRDAPG